LIFTADEPERLRGKQHYKLWCDELASWRFPEEAWNQAMLGLRLGSSPQAVVTTTPKPLKLIKELMVAPTTYETHGTSYENRVNLAPAFLGQIITKYEGTRLGRQELDAELLEDNPGALWHHDQIDKLRVEKAPELDRIVIGVDPAVTSTENSAETGIIAASRGKERPPHFYILGDLSLQGSPDTWAERAVYGYRAHQADRLVGEVNNGGDLVEAVLRTKDLLFAYKAVHASRGKATRAEPVAALYEQGRVHHVGNFARLEDELCDFDPTVAQKSPDRMDALVWALWELATETFLDSNSITPGYIYTPTGLTEYACEKCYHHWTAQLGDVPKRCPECGDPRWDSEALFQKALQGTPLNESEISRL
jgi:phage terminase large subunit-like protein